METEIAARLQEYYESKFASWSNIALSLMSRIGEGWENEVYSYKLEYEEAGESMCQNLVLRIYPGDGAREKSRREYNTMKTLDGMGFPVPRVRLLEPDLSLFGKPFVVMDRVDGRLMGDLFFESARRKRRELLNLFCEMFVQLHSLDWQPFAPYFSQRSARNPQLFTIEKISEVQEQFRSLEKSEFDPVFDWLRKRTPGIRFGAPSLIHWDYHPWNIIMKENGSAHVIDWTQAEILDFRFDVGWTVVLVSTHAHPWLARSVVRKYEQISRKKIEDIDYFEVAACLKRLFAASVSLTHGAERVGMRPGAEEVLKQHALPLKRVYAILQRRTGITIPAVERLLSLIS